MRNQDGGVWGLAPRSGRHVRIKFLFLPLSLVPSVVSGRGGLASWPLSRPGLIGWPLFLALWGSRIVTVASRSSQGFPWRLEMALVCGFLAWLKLVITQLTPCNRLGKGVKLPITCVYDTPHREEDCRKMRVRRNISITPDTDRRLMAYARDHHCSVSQAITDWVWSVSVRDDVAGSAVAPNVIVDDLRLARRKDTR